MENCKSDKLKYSHRDLCLIAHKILKTKLKATIAIYEPKGIKENPDAIGWKYINGTRYEGSILIECKTSRGDFRNDFKKSFRINPDDGIGNWRYYLVPEGLITVEELPEKWGLIEVNSRGHTKIIKDVSSTNSLKMKNKFKVFNIENERFLLTRWLNRIGDCDKTSLLIRELYSKNSKLEEKLEIALKSNREDRLLINQLTNFGNVDKMSKSDLKRYISILKNIAYQSIDSEDEFIIQSLNELKKYDKIIANSLKS